MKPVLVLPLLLGLSACADGGSTEARAESAAPTLRTAPAEAATWRPTLEVTGTLAPIATVHLGFDVPGRLAELLVDRGDAVAKGDPIARLDAALASAQLAQAEAAVAAATAQAEAAREAWGRLEKMGDAVSAQQRSEIRAGRDAAEAQLAQAEAAARMARTNVGYHTLRAPIGGVVTNGPDNAGILVGAGTPMFVIEDLSALQLKGTAPEDATWLVAGLGATIRAGSPGAEIEVPATVVRVLPSLDPATRRVPVELRVDAPPAGLRANTFARATITGPETEVVAVPAGAVVARPDFSVFTATPGGAPERVPVTVLARDGGRALIRGAIAPGREVIVDPPHGYGE